MSEKMDIGEMAKVRCVLDDSSRGSNGSSQTEDPVWNIHSGRRAPQAIGRNLFPSSLRTDALRLLYFGARRRSVLGLQ